MTDDLLSKLERLAKLKEQGIITDSEFSAQKAALLATKPDPTPQPPAITSTQPNKTESTPVPINKPAPSWGKLVIGSLVVLFFIGLVNQCNEDNKAKNEQSSSTESTMANDSSSVATVDTPPTPIENWSYYNDTDKMGSSIHTATVTAADLLEFDFPYNGGSVATLTIRKKSGSTDLFLRVSKGQFITSASEGGKARIRFDGGTPGTYYTSGAADYSSDIVFFDSAKSIIAKMKKSKKMVIEVEFYHEGNRQIEFNVAGLKWNR